ncbi:porin [Blastochloris viridis]|uniref:Porin n=1 Tax=Blastochloris viridis TaxID=1079 RepID=A0A182D3G1_BLAVI|nr:porin [Blastochloris viridis]
MAVASAQAADLPAKSKAVEYVKVCDAYGAGFYYIPGTDVCLKVGGYLRADYYTAFANGGTAPLYIGQNNITQDGNVSYDRADDLTTTRARVAIDLDARTRTEYGTLRSYGRFYVSNDSAGGSSTLTNSVSSRAVDMDRAFIQFAGFTFGYVQSFFDFSTGLGTFVTANVGSNKLNNVFAYTASLGNGLSVTIAAEDAANRRSQIQARAGLTTPDTFDLDNGTGHVSYTDGTLAQAGLAMPEFVANIRIDQSWGSAQLSGAIHQLRSDTSDLAQVAGFTRAEDNDTDYGFAIGAGITFNLDSLTKGDQFIVQGSYADGATEYTGLSGQNQNGGRPGLGIIRGTSGAVVDLADGYVDPVTGSIEKVSAWTIRADFRHFWTPGLRSTLFGGYSSVDVPEVVGVTNYAGATVGTGGYYSTARDFNLYQIGFNTTWSPVRNLDIGVELLYSKIDVGGDFDPDGKAYYQNDEDIFSGMLRVQRNF